MQVDLNTNLAATSRKSSSASQSNTFANLSSVDSHELMSLLHNIATASAGADINQQDLDELQTLLAAGGVDIQDSDALAILAKGATTGTISNDDLQSLINLMNGLQNLPPATQQAVNEQLIIKAEALVNQYLKDKDLSSEEANAAQQLAAAINSAQALQTGLQTVAKTLALPSLNSAPSLPDGSSPDPSAAIGDIFANATMLSGGLTTPQGFAALNFDTQLFVTSAGSGNLDPIMQAIIILFSYVNNVQASTLRSFENNYQMIQDNITAVTSGQTGLLEVTQFMAANTANMPANGINVFAALDLMLCTATGTTPSPDIFTTAGQTTFYNAFISSCPNFMAQLSTAYYAAEPNIIVPTPTPPATFSLLDQLAAGDVVTAPVDGYAFNGQAMVMSYFIQAANAAGFNISGLSSMPIYPMAWTNNTSGGVEESTGISGLYTNPGGPPSPTDDLEFGAQLTFNATTVSQFIGSGGAGQSGNGALGLMSQTLTNGSTTSNTVQSIINAVTQSISGVWTLIGQSLIPADKFPG